MKRCFLFVVQEYYISGLFNIKYVSGGMYMLNKIRCKNVLKKSYNSVQERYTTIIIFLVIFSFMCIMVSLEDKEYREEKSIGATSCDIEAVLYENANYTGTGVKLTTAGINVSGWDVGVSKYLEVGVTIDQGSSKKHIVEINMPRQLYVVSQDVDYVIPGFESVQFQHNGSMKINGDAGVYTYHENSGKLTYVLEVSDTSIITEATIQLELRYDDAFWDKQIGFA